MMDSELFQSRFIALSATLMHPLQTYDLQRLEREITEATVAGQLAPMLVSGVVPERASLIDGAWRVAGKFVELRKKERDYIDSIQQGDFALESLFPNDPEEVRRLSEHPAILWKVSNVRAHLERT